MKPQAPKPVVLDGQSLTRADAVRVARGEDGRFPEVRLDVTKVHLADVRAKVEEWLRTGSSPAYGFHTGVGALKNRLVPPEESRVFQVEYLRAHAVGVGPLLGASEVRAAILLKANNLARGNSGVRQELVEGLLSMLNLRVHPAIPAQGSMGASGDLAPLSHLALVLCGESDVVLDDEGKPSGSARARGFHPLALEEKEAMALTNSSSVVHAIGLLAVADAENLLKTADLAAALSCEAMFAEAGAFDPRIQEARGFPGQIAAAENVRRVREGTARAGEDGRRRFYRARGAKGNPPPRVQDAYSLRCVPQVHGACHDAWHVAAGALERELNAATDNPLIFVEPGGGIVAISGGNFHGQPLALPLDHLGLALATLGNISERRTFRLLNPELSYGLPLNLVPGDAPHRTGLMISQYTAAALVSENKGLVWPSSADSIPASGDQEDFVSMGMGSARRTAEIVRNVTEILAIELLCAVQGLLLSEEILGAGSLPMGKGAAAVLALFRREGFAPYEQEKVYAAEIRRVASLARSGMLVREVEKAAGGALAL